MRAAPGWLSMAPDWDGHVLSLPSSWPQRAALDIDGEYFADLILDADARAHLAFPFSPSGCAAFTPTLRRERDGDVLWPPAEAQPVQWRFASHATGELLVDDSAHPALANVVVVVPVYNAAAAVARCLASVLAHTTGRTRLLVIDDASSDPAIAPLLARYRDTAGIEVLRNEENRGFTATANRGIERAGRADVVLLNADTEVGPNWLTGLRRAAYARADIATATAVSDNAGAFSVPELERENPLPANWTIAQTARALWQRSGLAYPQLPTGNGFCMYIRRDVIDAVGALDEIAFAQGYGEENDFCQRAAAGGRRHVIAGNVFVHHERSMSFGVERRLELGRTGMQVLRERWPHYEADVGRTLFSFERRVLDWRVRQIHAKATPVNAPQPRVLRISRNDDALKIEGFDIWRCVGDTTHVELWSADTNIDAPIERANPSSPGPAAWLQRHAIELVDVSSMPSAALSSTLADAAHRLGIAVVDVTLLAHVQVSDYTIAINALRSFPELPA